MASGSIDLPTSRFDEVLRPRSFVSQKMEGWGDHRIEIRGCPISFSFEDPGIQVSSEGEGLAYAEAAQIVAEIAESIADACKQGARVVPL